MPTPTESARKQAASLPVSVGLVFELEKLAVPGRRLLFEACRKVLKDKQIDLTPVLWSRFGLTGPLAQGLEGLFAAVGKKSLAADKLAREIQAVFQREIVRPAVKLNAALDDILTEAAKLGFKAGALSFMPEEEAQALLVHLGLQERVGLRAVQKAAAIVPTPDCWLMTCKAIGVPARRCVAVVESAAACHAALEAGLRCVVAPDEYTAYQDFGGADQVVDELKDVHAKDLLALLHSCAFR